MEPFTSCLQGRKSSDVLLEDERTKKVEDHVPGYPRYTALLSAHVPFFLGRRFDRLRARLFLSKQDELSLLEQNLDKVDEEETCPLFLGRRRNDGNKHRKKLLKKISSSLADYDRFVERTHRMLSLDPAKSRDAQSLRNWLNGTGCIARDETAYLGHNRELVSLAASGDTALQQLEDWVEGKVIRFYRGFRKSHHHDISTDPNVYLYSGTLIKRTARVLLLFMITSLLLVPVIICNIISRTSVRIIIIILSTTSYIFILSELTKPKTMELTLAGATYATVLIVFVSGTSGISS